MNESNLPTRLNAKVTAIAIASIVLGAAIQSFAAVPPAGASGFGASSSSGGAGAVVSRTPPASGTSFSSTPASSAPFAGNLYLGIGVGTSTATGGLPSSAVGPATTFQGQGSALGAFGSNFPGQAGVGGDFRGPAGGAGAAVGGTNAQPSPLQPSPLQPTTPTTSAIAPNTSTSAAASPNTGAGVPGQTSLTGTLVNPLAVGPATSAMGPATNAVGPGTSASQASTSVAATTNAPINNWRYVNFNGLLWYWTPNNQWLYYQNGAWQPFPTSPTVLSGSAVPYTAGANAGAAPGATTTIR